MTDTASSSKPSKFTGFLQLAIWAFVFFMATRPFSFQLEGIDPAGPETQSARPWPDYIHYAISFAVGAYAVRRGALAAVFRTLSSTPLILAFVALAIISAAWSEEPYLTIRDGGGFAATVFTFAAMMTLLSKSQVTKAMLYGMSLCIVFSIIWALAFPHYGRHDPNDIYQAAHVGKWRGVYLHKNLLGQISGITVGAYFWANRGLLPRLFKYLIMAAALVCLVFAQSASGFLIAAIGAGFGFALFQLKGYPRMIAIAVGTFVCVLLSGVGSEVLSDVLVAMGKNPTFSGRTYLWQAAAELISDHWLLGYGLTTVYEHSIRAVFEKVGDVNDAHNGYLELILALGLVGLFLLLLSAIDGLYKGWNARLTGAANTVSRQIMTLIIVMWAFAALAESSPFLPDGPVEPFGLFAIMWLSAPSGVRRLSTPDSGSDPAKLTVKSSRPSSRRSRSFVEID